MRVRVKLSGWKMYDVHGSAHNTQRARFKKTKAMLRLPLKFNFMLSQKMATFSQS